MNLILKYNVSLFLAGIIYTASLFVLPPVNHVSVDGKSVVTFSKIETAKISGFTKNELTTTYNGQTIDVKNNAFTKNFFTVRHIEIVNLVVLITNRETTLLNSALSQLSKKILIFPFHTYW